MNVIRRLFTLKLIVPILIIAAGVVIYMASLPTNDAVGGPNVCSYYSDARYKTVVGARGTGCCGSVINWGITTPYKKCQTIYCPDVVCPD